MKASAGIFSSIGKSKNVNDWQNEKQHVPIDTMFYVEILDNDKHPRNASTPAYLSCGQCTIRIPRQNANPSVFMVATEGKCANSMHDYS